MLALCSAPLGSSLPPFGASKPSMAAARYNMPCFADGRCSLAGTWADSWEKKETFLIEACCQNNVCAPDETDPTHIVHSIRWGVAVMSLDPSFATQRVVHMAGLTGTVHAATKQEFTIQWSNGAVWERAAAAETATPTRGSGPTLARTAPY